MKGFSNIFAGLAITCFALAILFYCIEYNPKSDFILVLVLYAMGVLSGIMSLLVRKFKG